MHFHPFMKDKGQQKLFKSSHADYTFYKQLGLDPSPQSCLYFQDFYGLMLLNDCLVV